MIVDELVTLLKFEKAGEDKARQFNKQLDAVAKTARRAAMAAAAAATAILGITVASAKSTDELGKTAAEVGTTVENLDALQFAAERSGDSSEGLSSSLRQLSVRIGETARGMGRGKEAFEALGISVKDSNGEVKDSTDVLTEIVAKFEDLSRSEQLDFANKLGLGSATRLMQVGSEELANLVKEARSLGVASADDAKKAAAFNDSLTDLWQLAKGVGRTIGGALSPTLVKINKKFTAWYKTNKELFAQRIERFIEIVAKAFSMLFNVVAKIGSVLNKLVTYFEKNAFALEMLKFAAMSLIATGLISWALKLSKVLTVMKLKAALLYAPFLLLGVVAAALFIIWEDIVAWVNGDGESAFGNLEKMLNDNGSAWGKIFTAARKFLGWLGTAGAVVISLVTGDFGALKEALGDLFAPFDAILKRLKALRAAASKPIETTVKGLGYATIGSHMQPKKGVILASGEGELTETQRRQTLSIDDYVAEITAQSEAAAVTQNTNANTTNMNTSYSPTINVSAAQPSEAAEAVADINNQFAAEISRATPAVVAN